jgi:phage FluMu gp28-like protein
VLTKYRQVLPADEFAALSAWADTFWPFQREWLLDDAAQAVCNKSRQIGLSHTTSAVGVLWGAFHGELTTFISIGQLESSEVLTKAKKHAQVLRRLGSRMAALDGEGSATEIRFASGGRIIALPSSGGRSFTGNVFLDEFAFQEHEAKVWDAAAAITMLGSLKLRVASTPNGVGNEFHGLVKRAKQPDSNWSLHEIPIQVAADQGYPVDLKKCWEIAKGDPRLFAQLFECKFLDGEAQYIPTEAIDYCAQEYLDDGVGECYAGLDIGRTSDRTELIIVRKNPTGWRAQVYSEGCKRTSYEDVERLAAMAFSPMWNCTRLCVDATGMGTFPAEQLQRKFGNFRVEPVLFTQAVKEDLATSLYTAFTQRTAFIKKGDQALRDDLCAIRRIITSAGNIRYDAPHTDEGHADKAWALALALHACNDPANTRTVTSGR